MYTNKDEIRVLGSKRSTTMVLYKLPTQRGSTKGLILSEFPGFFPFTWTPQTLTYKLHAKMNRTRQISFIID